MNTTGSAATNPDARGSKGTIERGTRKVRQRKSPQAGASALADRPMRKTTAAKCPAAASQAETPARVAGMQPSKTELILALLTRSEGATVAQLVEATSWLPHTTRAMLSGLRRRGYVIVCERCPAGEDRQTRPSVYRLGSA